MVEYRIKQVEYTRNSKTEYIYSIEKKYLGLIWGSVRTKHCYTLPNSCGVLLGKAVFTFRTLGQCKEHLEKYFKNPYKEWYKGRLIVRRFSNSYRDCYVDQTSKLSDYAGENTYYCTMSEQDAKKEIDKRIETTDVKYIKLD